MGKRVRRQGRCLNEEGRSLEDVEGLLEKCCGVESGRGPNTRL